MGSITECEKQQTRIGVNALTTGMFLREILDAEDKLIRVENILIDNDDTIRDIKSAGAVSVFINPQKGKPAQRDDEITTLHFRKLSGDTLSGATHYNAELARAQEIHDMAIGTLRETFAAVRAKHPFSLAKIEAAADEIRDSIRRNADALISLMQLKSYEEYLCSHSLNMAILLCSIAAFSNLPPAVLSEVAVGGLLHDIGKMQMPEVLLSKPGKYADWEFTIIKKHPEYGLAVVKECGVTSETVHQIVAQHHERYNGTGYPRGLAKNQISDFGAMSAVIDVYDALTSDRVYRAAWTPRKALAFIFQKSDTEFAKSRVDLLTRYLGVYPVGSFVKLGCGIMGIVTRTDRDNLLSPTMLALFDDQNRRITEPFAIDLTKKQTEFPGTQYKILQTMNPVVFRINVAEYIQRQT